MEVTLARKAGFCGGVKRAVELAEAAGQRGIASGRQGAATLGPLVHNPRVVESLRERGVSEVNSLEQVGDRILVIPSHGFVPATVSAAREMGLELVDATCPHVLKAQRIAADLSANGYTIVLVGDASHPEVKAVMAHAGGHAVIVSGAGDCPDLDRDRPVAVMAQTTQRRSVVLEVLEELRRKGHDPEDINTICPATNERQHAALELARKVDLMVVVGGSRSANTRQLAEVCRSTGVRVLLVETAYQIDPRDLVGVGRVGVTAGASTPNRVIEEVIKAMVEFDGEVRSGEQSEQQASRQAEQGSSDGARPGPRIIEEPEIIKGRVVGMDAESVVVDIGTGSDVVIPKDQLSSKPFMHPSEIISVGEEVSVVLERLRPNDDTQYASKRKADYLLAWERLENAKDTGEPVSGVVTEAVRGGLVVDVGVRGFIPASQIGRRFVENLSEYVGRSLKMKVREIDPERGNVVLSHRAVLEEEEKAARGSLLQTLKPGEVREGKVSRITTFGAFVDIGAGVEGLLHISDISWSRIKHPGEVLSEGQEIKVQVLNVDPERERISLGYKQLLGDPWADMAAKFPVGSVVRGTVTKLMEFGAFVRLAEGVEGLVHVSQLSDRRVSKPDEVVSVGQEVQVKVIGLKEQEHRISLSIRQAWEEGEKTEYRRYINESKTDDVVTIADRIGWDPNKLKGRDDS